MCIRDRLKEGRRHKSYNMEVMYGSPYRFFKTPFDSNFIAILKQRSMFTVCLVYWGSTMVVYIHIGYALGYSLPWCWWQTFVCPLTLCQLWPLTTVYRTLLCCLQSNTLNWARPSVSTDRVGFNYYQPVSYTHLDVYKRQHTNHTLQYPVINSALRLLRFITLDAA